MNRALFIGGVAAIAGVLLFSKSGNIYIKGYPNMRMYEHQSFAREMDNGKWEGLVIATVPRRPTGVDYRSGADVKEFDKALSIVRAKALSNKKNAFVLEANQAKTPQTIAFKPGQSQSSYMAEALTSQTLQTAINRLG